MKDVRNTKQLIGFLAVITLCILFIIIFFAKPERGSYSLFVILLSFFLVAVFTFLIVFIFIGDNYFEYLKSKNWGRQTTDFLKSQDQTKTPAYITASEMKLNEGKKLAYKHCLEEINNVRNARLGLKELEHRINGTINSMEHDV